jgi:trehalose 6-phosphate phosphatase
MSRPLFDNLAEISAKAASRKEILLFLDYDGTLTGIVERPGAAELAPTTRDVIVSLSRLDGVHVAIISGRALEDVRARVAVPGLVCAGNHGLEIAGRGLSFVEPGAAATKGPLAEICAILAARLAHIQGVDVENKGLTSSIHFRRAAPSTEPEVLRIVRGALPAEDRRFVLRSGKKTFELRPRVDWHKGQAVLWIARELGAEAALTVYIGDDVTDEDAFSALPEGVTVKVGESGATSASYHVAGPPEVGKFLVWLDGIARSGGLHGNAPVK